MPPDYRSYPWWKPIPRAEAEKLIATGQMPRGRRVAVTIILSVFGLFAAGLGGAVIFSRSLPENIAKREAVAAEAARIEALPAYQKLDRSPTMVSDACMEAQMFIEKRLKVPSTAKFESCNNARSKLDGTILTLQTSVDAQNSFGAMLRNTYQVKLDGSGKYWRVVGDVVTVR